jgi:PAS domain S-box-containing protein
MQMGDRFFPKRQPQRWLRAGSILISIAALALLGTALRARFYRSSLSSVLLTLVLIALCIAIALHARFLLLARREHRETASTLDATEREYKSVFDNALDGILILDDQGVCLEANPAALKLFGTDHNDLVGEPIGRFYAGSGDFKEAWKQFLDRTYEHSETRILRGDGETIFVEYTAKADYLPGRHVAVLRDISQRKQAETALRESEQRFQQMATNIQEIFWMLDAETKQVIYVNQAYEAITGRSCETLRENPTSYKELIHPEDRDRILPKLEETAQMGQFDEEFRIIRPDHSIRWVWVRGFPVRDAEGVVRRLVGTAQDISSRKSAEEQMARNLDMAVTAQAEADAFRKTTLALTQNLSMDYVLDTLLESLLKLIPCESARVLLVEADTRIFVAREMQDREVSRRVPKPPATLDATDNRFLMQVLITRNSLLIADTSKEAEWAASKGFSNLRSWLCVPLVASGQVLGLLSLGDTRAQAFTQEHLRLAKSLAIPAAVAIQNARLYERAEIYGAELERRLADLEMTQQALRLAEEGRTLSEERFTKVFRSSPIAFSITTMDEDRLVDVNDAFERRYGYSREQLIGRTVFEIGIWDDASERRQVLSEIRRKGSVRNHVTRFRRPSGELIDTIFSAQAVELDGRQCLLAVSEDLRDQAHFPGGPTHKTAAAH